MSVTTINASQTPARCGRVAIHGKDLQVEWTAAAERAFAARSAPLIVELELYFSCLVKKFVHVRESAGAHPLAWVNDRLAVYFRPVTSTTCSVQTAERLGRQPEMELDTPATRRIAPRRLHLDYRDGQWRGEFWML